MRFVRPDFYDKFKCIADKCQHSCCVGWEIDVDDDSLDYYTSLDGEIGRELKANICLEPEAHFILCEDERCPFLEKNGLCKLINCLGEESLCDICAEHPRFYNYYDDREEARLGLCCEEAVRLLLEGEGPLILIAEGGTESDEERFREELFSIISDTRDSVGLCFAKAMEKFCTIYRSHFLSCWSDFFLQLERLDESWTEKLLLLKEAGDGIDIVSALENNRYRRLCQYFIYRHLLSSEDYSAVMEFCILATEIIAALDCICGFDPEHIRLFSSEIEYSDENLELIIEEILKNR